MVHPLAICKDVWAPCHWWSRSPKWWRSGRSPGRCLNEIKTGGYTKGGNNSGKILVFETWRKHSKVLFCKSVKMPSENIAFIFTNVGLGGVGGYVVASQCLQCPASSFIFTICLLQISHFHAFFVLTVFLSSATDLAFLGTSGGWVGHQSDTVARGGFHIHLTHNSLTTTIWHISLT